MKNVKSVNEYIQLEIITEIKDNDVRYIISDRCNMKTKEI